MKYLFICIALTAQASDQDFYDAQCRHLIYAIQEYGIPANAGDQYAQMILAQQEAACAGSSYKMLLPSMPGQPLRPIHLEVDE